MELISPVLQAIGLFAATNIDDIIVLSLFFARGAGARGTTAKIGIGQYLGFGGILVASVLVTLGASTFLPPEAIPYFGLIPLILGLIAAWKVWRQGGWDTRQDALYRAQIEHGVAYVSSLPAKVGFKTAAGLIAAAVAQQDS